MKDGNRELSFYKEKSGYGRRKSKDGQVVMGCTDF